MIETKSAPAAVRAKVTVREDDVIQVRQDGGYAAWYTLWKVLPGTYELEPELGYRFPYYEDLPVYVARVDAVVVEDYFEGHYGGVPISAMTGGAGYDTKKNAGKRGEVYLLFTPDGVLSHEAVELSEEDYDRLLDEALEYVRRKADNSFRCLHDWQDRTKMADLKWLAGHARTLTCEAEIYDELDATKARRAYNRKVEAEGRKGWTDPRETHVKRSGRRWTASAWRG